VLERSDPVESGKAALHRQGLGAEDKKAEQVTELQQFIDLTFNRGAFALPQGPGQDARRRRWTKNA